MRNQLLLVESKTRAKGLGLFFAALLMSPTGWAFSQEVIYTVPPPVAGTTTQQFSRVSYPPLPPGARIVSTQPVAIAGASNTGTVCPKCGRIHSKSQVVTTSYNAPASVTGGGTQNVLSMLNQQRSRQGLRTLRYDPALQAVAERRARKMASMSLKSHPPGSFAPGRYEGVGWSSSFSPKGVYACYTSDPNMSVAGAAMVRGRDGVYFAVVYR
ncbi:MAG: CAP domain-containing protein [Planctomycetota bacterium]